MVKFLLMTLCILAVPFEGWTAEINVSAAVNQYGIYVNHPIPGNLEITHPKNVPVDNNSFTMEGKPLQMQFVKDVPIGDQVLSIYSFEASPAEKGLHILPAISVKVGGSVYQTIPSTFEVTGLETPAAANPSPAPAAPQPTARKQAASTSSQPVPSGVSLKLEAKVDGSSSLYPGQRTKLVYYYYYTGDIELTKEDLPLLNPTGFLKIGQTDIQDYAQGGVSVRRITQEVEAQKPGKFSFGPSVIEGSYYTEDELGHRQYSASKLHSEVPGMTITVKSFPIEGKPASFNGAVGQFTFNVKMLTPPKVNVGDRVQLSLDVSGKASDWANLPMPELCCQPGFSGLFQASDLPPAGTVKGDAKNFVVDLRPLSKSITVIPSIEFSYFDPSSATYKILRSQPIPLSVMASATPPPPPPPPTVEKKQAEEPQVTTHAAPEIEKKVFTPPPIEIISSYPLSSSDLTNYAFGSWWAFLILPLGAFLIYYQIQTKKKMENQPKVVKTQTSEELFQQAMKLQPEAPLFFRYLTDAFLMRLVERKDIESSDIDPKNLPDTGLIGEVRAFLYKLEEKRYTGQMTAFGANIKENARNLFEKLKK